MELLVAMAVLILIALVLTQMLGATSQTWLVGQAKVNNFAKARAMLDLLSRDIEAGVYRADLAAFPGTNVALFTERQGFSSGTNKVRNVSWVQYSLGTQTNATLQRSDVAIDWENPALFQFGSTNLPTTSPQDVRDMAPGVVAFKVLFLYGDGSLKTTYDPAKPPKACAIGLAVVDDRTLDIMNSSAPEKISALQDYFATITTGTNSLQSDWEKHLQSDMNWGNYPQSLATGLKVFERYVVLP